MEFLDLVKPYLEVGMLGLSAIFVIAFAWLAFKRNIDREKELVEDNRNNNKQEDEKFTKLFDMMIEQNQKSQDTMFSLLTQKLDNMAEKIITGVTGHTISHDENTTLSEKEQQINDCLKRTQQKTDASRVALVRFHNGGRDMNGLSFLKMSMTNECPGPGFAAIMPEFQNLFRSFFSYWCECLIKDGHCYIKDIEDIKSIDTTMYEYFISRKVQALFGVSLVNNEGSVIGFILIEFVNKNNINIEQVEHCLHDKKIKIETILNLNS